VACVLAVTAVGASYLPARQPGDGAAPDLAGIAGLIPPAPSGSLAHPRIGHAKEAPMLELLIVVLIVLWLLGYFGPARIPAIPKTGNLVHVLLIIIVILIVIRLLG